MGNAPLHGFVLTYKGKLLRFIFLSITDFVVTVLRMSACIKRFSTNYLNCSNVCSINSFHSLKRIMIEGMGEGMICISLNSYTLSEL